MANVNRPMGIRPSRYLDGTQWNGQAALYYFHASQANDAYIYDLVTFDATNRGSGTTDPYASGIPAAAPVTAALTTNKFRGIIVGFLVQPDFNMSVTASLGLKYRQASTARYGWIMEDQAVLCEAQESGTAMGIANISNNIDILYTAGSQTTGVSKVQIDTSTKTAAAVKPLRLYRYSQIIGNEPGNTNAKWDVTINNSDLVPGSNGI